MGLNTVTHASEQNPPAILITGASSGIGEACALELDEQGFRIFAAVRSETTAERLRESSSERLTPVILDVTDAPSIAAAAELVRDTVGEAGLAGLVNNAGIAIVGPLELLPLDALRRQFEVNVIGQIAVTQAMMPLLRTAKGRIVNVSSINGAISPPYFGPYASSKFAIEALSDALRGELRQWGIHVSVVAPGPVRTPIWGKTLSTSDQLSESVSQESLELYKTHIDVVDRLPNKVLKEAMPMQWVVDAIVHALTAQRPKIRYYITWRTRLTFRAFRMVPDVIRDWVVRREMGI